jgi:hypothetical protein
MRYFKQHTLKTIAIGLALFAGACDTDVQKPILSDDSKFTAPALTNTSNSTTTELTVDNAADTYDKFEWSKSVYDGLNLATTYTLEASKTDDFASPRTLATTTTSSATITKGQLNDALLAMGVPGFTEATISFRVKSVITGQDHPPLISTPISRKIKTFQASDCGKYCTVGIIGSAAPGGWEVDVDMHLKDATRVDRSTWTVTLYLTAGDVKFRAQDGWDINWGAAAFPAGTGTQNGANIAVPTAGYYKVEFNDDTGAYAFTALTTPEYPTVGIIGTATDGGWDADTNLTKDGTNPHLWTATLTLKDGEAKFRANDAWDMNWGGNTARSGYATKDGPNVPVTAGTYFIRFNDATGEYFLMSTLWSTPFDKIGLIGPAQAGGWDSDTDLVKDPANPFIWSKILTITEGDAKFRANDAWDVNWGATTFPSGVGVKDGPNIPAKAGTYFITINTGTGEYTFLK